MFSPRAERLYYIEKKLNKNSISLPLLRLAPSSEVLGTTHELTIRLSHSHLSALPPRVTTPVRKPRRRWSVHGDSVGLSTGLKRSPVAITVPRKLRSSRSHELRPLTAAPIVLNIPQLLDPCMEDDTTCDDAPAPHDLKGAAIGTPITELSDADAVTTATSPATALSNDDTVPASTRHSSSPPGIRGSPKWKGVDRLARRRTTARIMHSSCPTTVKEPASEATLEEEKRLRRKGGLVQLRMSAPATSANHSAALASSRRPTSHPIQASSSTSIMSSASSIPITQLQYHCSRSDSNDIPRIGHRTMPYYSTIMRREGPASRHSTPARAVSDNTNPSTTDSRPLSAPSSLSGRSLFLSSQVNLALTSNGSTYSPGEFGYIPSTDTANSNSTRKAHHHHHHSGFSLSGEAERRMALAGYSYKYKDMSVRGVRGHVKRLGKEIKEKWFKK